MAKAKNIQQITLTAVCVAVLAACGGGGGSSGSPNTSSTDTGAYVEEAKAANKVRLQIEAIGAADTLEVGDVAAVQRAEDAFNNLNDLEKNLVPLASRNALKAMVTTINTNAALPYAPYSMCRQSMTSCSPLSGSSQPSTAGLAAISTRLPAPSTSGIAPTRLWQRNCGKRPPTLPPSSMKS